MPFANVCDTSCAASAIYDQHSHHENRVLNACASGVQAGPSEAAKAFLSPDRPKENVHVAFGGSPARRLSLKRSAAGCRDIRTCFASPAAVGSGGRGSSGGLGDSVAGSSGSASPAAAESRPASKRRLAFENATAQPASAAAASKAATAAPAPPAVSGPADRQAGPGGLVTAAAPAQMSPPVPTPEAKAAPPAAAAAAAQQATQPPAAAAAAAASPPATNPGAVAQPPAGAQPAAQPPHAGIAANVPTATRHLGNCGGHAAGAAAAAPADVTAAAGLVSGGDGGMAGAVLRGELTAGSQGEAAVRQVSDEELAWRTREILKNVDEQARGQLKPCHNAFVGSCCLGSACCAGLCCLPVGDW